MFVHDETLLCLHSEDGRASMTFSLAGEDCDPPVGRKDYIFGIPYLVIRCAEMEPCQDGNSYLVVHGKKVAWN